MSTTSLHKPSVWNALIFPWVVCMVAALFYGYDFFLRVAPSVMINSLMHQYHVGAITIGLISAFYYYAYTPLQIPSGIIVDRFNVHLVLVVSMVLCVIGVFMFAYISNIYIAYLARALMGIGSAFAFVGALKLAARWLPKNKFALFSGLATGVGTLGAIGADWILSRLVAHYGWQQATVFTAYLGLAIGVLMLVFIRNMPPWLQEVHIPKAKWKKTFWRLWLIIKRGRTWFNGFVGCAMFIPINVFASLWGVAFLIEGKHFSATQAASITSLIFIGAAIGSPIAGWFSDFIKSRRLPLLIGNFMILVITLLLIYTNITSHQLIYALLFFLGFFVGPEVLVFAIAREISPPHTTGISTATTNFLVTLGAAFLQPLIGVILHYTWNGVRSLAGTPIYNITSYKWAFILLPVFSILSFCAVFLIPKTHCKQLHDAAEDFEHVPDEKNPYYALRIFRRKKSNNDK